MKRRKQKIQHLTQKQAVELRCSLLQKQNGICPICDRDVNSPCLDHSHTKRVKGSGLIRGVLCRSCNVLIAKMENNCVRYGIQQSILPSVLRRMATYLEQDHLPFLHPSEVPKRKKIMKSSFNALLKAMADEKKKPEFPKSGFLTKQLEALFTKFNIEPKFYNDKKEK